MSAGELEQRASAPKENVRRGWSWAALVAAIVLWVAGIPSWGLSVLLSPVSALLTVVAWHRSAHDAVFWIGFGMNALLLIGFISLLIGVVHGDFSLFFG